MTKLKWQVTIILVLKLIGVITLFLCCFSPSHRPSIDAVQMESHLFSRGQ